MSVVSTRSLLRMFASVSLVLVLAAALSAGEDNDWQGWTSLKISVGVTDTLSVYAKPAVRYKDDLDTWFYERYDFGFTVKLGDHWKVSPLYSAKRSKGASGWNRSDVWAADISYSTPLESVGVDFETRFRFERNFDNEREYGYQKVALSRGVSLLGGSTVFVSNDLIYDFSGGDFYENRASAGIKKTLKCGVSVETAYQLTSYRRGGHWEDFNTAVVNFGLSL